MSQNYDVFISYAHSDNQKMPDEKIGWVTSFHECLKISLHRWLGRPPRIFFDEKAISGDARVTPTIFNDLGRSSILISIISPSYVNSEWCPKEWDTFCCDVGRNFGNKSRIYYIVTTPINTVQIFNEDNLKGQELKELLQDENKLDIPGFKFFTGEDVPELLSPSDIEFKRNVNIVAFKIREILAELQADSSPRKIIYLAETTLDLKDQRIQIRADLVQKRFRVLPPHNYPRPSDFNDYQQLVRENINSCDLAVHLIGNNYGDILPNAPDKELSHLRLQTEIAAVRDNDPAFKRLVWLSKSSETADARHENFIKELQKSASSKVEILQNPPYLLTELQTQIQKFLEKEEEEESDTQIARNSFDNGINPYVYIFCEIDDVTAVKALEDVLYEKFKCEVYSYAHSFRDKPDDNSQPDFLTHFKNWSKICHGALLYWKTPPRSWIDNAVPQFREIFSGDSLGIFLGDDADEKLEYRTHRAQIIKSDEELSRFVQNLRSKLRGGK
jgi:TIR domain